MSGGIVTESVSENYGGIALGKEMLTLGKELGFSFLDGMMFYMLMGWLIVIV